MEENKKMGEKTNEKKEEKIVLDIPVDGSLGLLAYGHRGLLAWRKKRDEEKIKNAKNE